MRTAVKPFASVFAILCAFSLLTSACQHLPDDVEERPLSVYLVSHGWHSGIALRWEDIDDHPWPVLETFSDIKYLEVGWGDAGWYPNPDPGLWELVRAAFWPTQSVVQLAGINRPLPDYFRRSEIIQLELTSDGFDALLSFIESELPAIRDEAPEPVASSLYGWGYFVPAHRSYHILANSNRWAAQALQEAGLPFAPSFVLTNTQLSQQARQVGEIVQEGR